MKKIVSALLLGVLAVSLAGCTGMSRVAGSQPVLQPGSGYEVEVPIGG